MGLFGRMFGGKTFEEEMAEGAKYLAKKEYGQAKHAFENAVEKAAHEQLKADAQAQLVVTCNALAEARLTEADRYIAEGQWEFAIAELEGAAEVAHSDELRRRASERINSLEHQDAIAMAAGPVEITREQRLLGVAGVWEPAQEEEYERYGAPFADALVDVLIAAEELSNAAPPGEGASPPPLPAKLAAAIAYFEGLVGDAGARYVLLELGRARLVAGDKDGGAESLRNFLEKLDAYDGGEARLSAHMELAHLAEERGESAVAMAELEAAVTAMDEDPRPYLALGQYLRRKGSPGEAVEVLDAAVAVIGEGRPDWRVLEELGLAHKDAGNTEEAFRYLEQVVQLMMRASQGRNYGKAPDVDLPPATATALAALFENDGRLDRAADMYRILATGSDRRNHARYNVEAARCLMQLNLPTEAARMLERALALTDGAPEAQAEIRKKLDEAKGLALAKPALQQPG